MKLSDWEREERRLNALERIERKRKLETTRHEDLPEYSFEREYLNSIRPPTPILTTIPLEERAKKDKKPKSKVTPFTETSKQQRYYERNKEFLREKYRERYRASKGLKVPPGITDLRTLGNNPTGMGRIPRPKLSEEEILKRDLERRERYRETRRRYYETHAEDLKQKARDRRHKLSNRYEFSNNGCEVCGKNQKDYRHNGRACGNFYFFVDDSNNYTGYLCRTCLKIINKAKLDESILLRQRQYLLDKKRKQLPSK